MNDTNTTATNAGSKRRWIIAVIILIVAGLGIVAALVLPGIITDRQAQAAAEAYTAEREEWLSVFTEEALEPYLSADATDYTQALTEAEEAVDFSWTRQSTFPDSSAVRAACTDFTEFEQGLDVFSSVSMPQLEEIDGGESNEAYAAAQERQAAERDAYEASESFVSEIESAVTDIAQGCEYIIASIDAHQMVVETYNAYLAALTVPQGEDVYLGRGDHQGEVVDFYLECAQESGCAPFDDMDKRSEAGDLWDTAAEARHLGNADLLERLCPTKLQEACDLAFEVENVMYEISIPVGEAYRTEDPAAKVLAGGDKATDEWNAALADYNQTWRTEYEEVSAEIEPLTGEPTIQGAVDDLIVSAVERISVAAAAVQVST